MTGSGPTSEQMVTALTGLRQALQRVTLPLELLGVADARSGRDEMVDQIEDYVVPRLRQIDAPLLAVVGGSTGAGKSTLVNSLVRAPVSATGVLRPTTRSPVLVHHPSEGHWFAGDRILPDLARTTGPAGAPGPSGQPGPASSVAGQPGPASSVAGQPGAASSVAGQPGSLRLVAADTVPPGLAILDAPDIDSIERSNRVLATQLLAAADLWLFVTSAARYADQVPWQLLLAAAERSAAVAVVLDRTPPGAAEEVAADLARMLSARGLRSSPLFVVTEGVVDEAGLLDPSLVAGVRAWLDGLAADAEARAEVVRQTLDGAVRSLAGRAHALADAQAEQVAAVQRLRADVDRAYAEAVEQVGKASADGSLLRGEVLARWQEFVGTGELLRSLETRVGRLRDRLVGWAVGKPQQAERVTVAVESGLETLILEHAETAAEGVERSWHSVEEGRRLLETSGDVLGRASRDFRGRAERAVRDWQSGVLDLVRTEGADRRSTARFLAFGVNGLGVALMVVVFASTGAVTGAEAGIAGGTAVLGQKLLEAVFGDQAVRRLAEGARRDLQQRVDGLMDAEAARFAVLLEGLGIDPDDEQRLRDAAREVDDLRFAQRRARQGADAVGGSADEVPAAGWPR